MFELIDNTLCVPASLLYDEIGLLSYDNYRQMCVRGHLKKVVVGGNGRRAMVDFATMPSGMRMQLLKLCDGKSPWEIAAGNKLKGLIKQDLNAFQYFNEFVKANGEPLPEEKKREYMAGVNVLNAIAEAIRDKNHYRRTIGGNKLNIWDRLSNDVNELRSDEIPHGLPQRPRPLRNRFDRYRREGYASLVHGGVGNSNTEKLSLVAKSWLLARWATPLEKLTMTQLWEEFNALSDARGWKPVEDQKTIRNYLYQPDIKEQWYGHRYGELKSKEKYAYQHSTKLPTMRDSLWYSDGTKLNLYYMEEGKIETTSVYEVMDTYSEVFLGFHISKKEDFAAQFSAFKMAAQFSGHRPYECRYDNQGGHKKLQNGDFLSKISRLSIRTQPYNGKSKTIENAFGRFQQQFLHRKWHFTGQNVTAKKMESKPNLEFVLANKHDIPSYREMVDAYIEMRNEWNKAPHPLTGKPRIEMYLQSKNDKAPAISFFDMVDLFWIQREKTVRYAAYGLTIIEKGRKYTYTKYDQDRLPDIRWHRSNVDSKFTIRFDPSDMSRICVYKETPTGLQYAGTLEQKIEVHRGKQEAEEGEASFLALVNEANKVARIQRRDNTNEVLESFNLLPEQHGLVSPPLKGIESAKKAAGNRRKKVAQVDVAELDKALSNEVPDLNDKEALYKKMY